MTDGWSHGAAGTPAGRKQREEGAPAVYQRGAAGMPAGWKHGEENACLSAVSREKKACLSSGGMERQECLTVENTEVKRRNGMEHGRK